MQRADATNRRLLVRIFFDDAIAAGVQAIGIAPAISRTADPAPLRLKAANRRGDALDDAFALDLRKHRNQIQMQTSGRRLRVDVFAGRKQRAALIRELFVDELANLEARSTEPIALRNHQSERLPRLQQSNHLLKPRTIEVF